MKFKTIKFNLYLLIGIISFSCNSISDKGVTKEDYITASKLAMLKSSDKYYNHDQYKTYLQTFTDVNQIITYSQTLDNVIDCDPKDPKYSDLIYSNKETIKGLFPKNQQEYVDEVFFDVDNYLYKNKELNNTKDNLILGQLNKSTMNIIGFCLYQRNLKVYTPEKYYDNEGYGIYANYLIKQKTDPLNSKKYFQNNFSNSNYIVNAMLISPLDIKKTCSKFSKKDKDTILDRLQYKKYIPELDNKSILIPPHNIPNTNYTEYADSKDLMLIKHNEILTCGYIQKHENKNIFIPYDIYKTIIRFFPKYDVLTKTFLTKTFKNIIITEDVESLRLFLNSYNNFDINSIVFDSSVFKLNILDFIAFFGSEKDSNLYIKKTKYIEDGIFDENNNLGLSSKMLQIIDILKKHGANLSSNQNSCTIL